MPYTADEMLAWNYEKAMKIYKEFVANSTNAHGAELLKDINGFLYLVSRRRYASVSDYTHDNRGGKQRVREIIRNSKENTLILVDGESGTGKSTFAAKLCKKERFFLFDIDKQAEDLTIEHMKTANAEMILYNMEPYILYPNGSIISVDAKSDELLEQQTEEIIRKGSENGKKTTVIVGAFRNVVHRAIIARTIGKNFERVCSIVIHDKLQDNLARIKRRNGGVNEMDAIQIATNTYREMEELKAGAFMHYGIGCTDSCWVNHSAVHDF